MKPGIRIRRIRNAARGRARHAGRRRARDRRHSRGLVPRLRSMPDSGLPHSRCSRPRHREGLPLPWHGSAFRHSLWGVKPHRCRRHGASRRERGPLRESTAWTCLHGVGKVNAAIVLTRRSPVFARRAGPSARRQFRHGGGLTVPPARWSVVVVCRSRHGCGPLGFALGETPFDEPPALLVVPVVLSGSQEVICGNGYSFATRTHHVGSATSWTWRRMRSRRPAASKARICLREVRGDRADEKAAEHWRENVAGAADASWIFTKSSSIGLLSGASLA